MYSSSPVQPDYGKGASLPVLAGPCPRCGSKKKVIVKGVNLICPDCRLSVHITLNSGSDAATLWNHGKSLIRPVEENIKAFGNSYVGRFVTEIYSGRDNFIKTVEKDLGLHLTVRECEMDREDEGYILYDPIRLPNGY